MFGVLLADGTVLAEDGKIESVSVRSYDNEGYPEICIDSKKVNGQGSFSRQSIKDLIGMDVIFTINGRRKEGFKGFNFTVVKNTPIEDWSGITFFKDEPVCRWHGILMTDEKCEELFGFPYTEDYLEGPGYIIIGTTLYCDKIKVTKELSDHLSSIKEIVPMNEMNPFYDIAKYLEFKKALDKYYESEFRSK